MQKMIHKVASWALLAGLLLNGAPLRAATSADKQPAVKVTTGPSAVDELLALLPVSDVVAVIDAQRAFAELLPLLKNISTGGIGKTAADVETFAKLAGVEPKQIQAAVLGVKMTETLSRGSGVLLLQGVELDGAKMTEAVKALGGELQTTEYNGKSLFTISRKRGPNEGPELTQFALLGNKRLAIGDLPALKSVLDGGAKGSQAALGQTLKEAKTTGLVRFAGNLPEGLRTMLASQGELFEQVAAVKTIFGSLDLNADNSAILTARLRTASTNAAGQLKESLNGLVALGKVFLSGNEDATMKLYGQLLEQVKLGVEASDVSLLLQLPKELMDKLK
ncbi:MAG: hypothetical protein HYR56_12950 [Acidobacteria bacterium]|nr:hypothetical protein [Acidobacteriota bacterium]MBI3427046.1 hypothetical protein [Acidobacteriota bacterium]